MDCRTALLTVLDQVDYTKGNCGVTEMVGGVLPKEIIVLARKAIADETSASDAALKDFDEFLRFCFEHGGTLRNHKQFSEMAQKLRASMDTTTHG